MPTYLTHVDWVVAQLRREDWIGRHALVQRLRITKPGLYAKILERMSPDELINGECGGVAANRDAAIVSKDKPRKAYKQLTLHRYFYPKPKKEPYLQLSLHKFFKRRE